MRIVGLLAAGAVGAVTLAGCAVDKNKFEFDGQAGESGDGAGGTSGGRGSSKGGGGSGAAGSVCDSAPCLNQGQCTDVGGGRYQCACSPGYGGVRCEIDIDDCAVDRCKNGGVCVDRVNDYECQCSVGYGGKDCELADDDCARMPCQNGGECVDGNARYTCVCPAGFSGLDCERAVSGCADAPCLNGECSETAGGYTCACSAGFTGKNCETDIDECLTQPCHNDAACIDGVNGRTCQCKAGSDGPDCDVDVDECQDNPCQNGGECENLSPGFECDCPPEWTGKTCELDVDECASAGACPAGRSCVNEAGGHDCPCAPGGIGANCERVFDVLPPVEHYEDCFGWDVNADGSVVVGGCRQGSGTGQVAYRWSEATGMEALEGLREPAARRVSDDGNVIAGDHAYIQGATSVVFRWTRATGMVAIDLRANCVMNADGSVVAAASSRWTPSGIQDLSPIIQAQAVSGDGNVIVGSGSSQEQVYRWTPSSVDELPVPTGARFVWVWAMSTDGSTLVGRVDIGDTTGGIIWRGTELVRSSGLPELSAISGDGSVMITYHPVGIWDETQGFRDLKQMLNAQGAAIPEAQLFASAISRDGRYVVGTMQVKGQPDRAFRAKLP